VVSGRTLKGTSAFKMGKSQSHYQQGKGEKKIPEPVGQKKERDVGTRGGQEKEPRADGGEKEKSGKKRYESEENVKWKERKTGSQSGGGPSRKMEKNECENHAGEGVVIENPHLWGGKDRETKNCQLQ